MFGSVMHFLSHFVLDSIMLDADDTFAFLLRNSNIATQQVRVMEFNLIVFPLAVLRVVNTVHFRTRFPSLVPPSVSNCLKLQWLVGRVPESRLYWKTS